MVTKKQTITTIIFFTTTITITLVILAGIHYNTTWVEAFTHTWMIRTTIIGTIIIGYALVWRTTITHKEQMDKENIVESLMPVIFNQHPEDNTYTTILWILRIFLIALIIVLTSTVISVMI